MYRVGDRVRMRVPDNWPVDAKQYDGMDMTIESIFEAGLECEPEMGTIYAMIEDGKTWCWTNECIEGLSDDIDGVSIDMPNALEMIVL